ncbi:MAG: universal stress protein [Paracoccaceae bacterium]
MIARLVVGVDGGGTGNRALAHAKKIARLIGDCELVLVYVIEWSPYSFHSAEENAQRHKRREEEIAAAESRVLAPAVGALKEAGFAARSVVRHGDVAELLNSVAVEEEADQIIIARSSDGGFAARVFGSSTANLVMTASVPVTVVG